MMEKAPGDSFQTLLEFANKLVDKFVGFLLHVSFWCKMDNLISDEWTSDFVTCLASW